MVHLKFSKAFYKISQLYVYFTYAPSIALFYFSAPPLPPPRKKIFLGPPLLSEVNGENKHSSIQVSQILCPRVQDLLDKFKS